MKKRTSDYTKQERDRLEEKKRRVFFDIFGVIHRPGSDRPCAQKGAEYKSRTADATPKTAQFSTTSKEFHWNVIDAMRLTITIFQAQPLKAPAWVMEWMHQP